MTVTGVSVEVGDGDGKVREGLSEVGVEEGVDPAGGVKMVHTSACRGNSAG